MPEKRLSASIGLVIAAAASLLASCPSAVAQSGCQPGDVAPLGNVDDQVTVADATVALRAALDMVDLGNSVVSGNWEVNHDPGDPPRVFGCWDPANNGTLSGNTPFTAPLVQDGCTFYSAGVNLLPDGDPYWITGTVRLNQLQIFYIDPTGQIFAAGHFEDPVFRAQVTHMFVFVDPGCQGAGTYILTRR